jgi:hypothetical protein
MAKATTTVSITLAPARTLLPGTLTISGVNNTFVPTTNLLISDSASAFAKSFVWSSTLQTIELRILATWTTETVISFLVTNGNVNSRANLKTYYNNIESGIEPSLFICSKPSLVYASISGSSNVQGQLNQISVILEFNFEIVSGSVLTISGLLNTTTPDNDQLALDGGVGYLLGYSGQWRQGSGTLVVRATDSLNLNNRRFTISFELQNGLSLFRMKQTIKVLLTPSASNGKECGGVVCDLGQQSPLTMGPCGAIGDASDAFQSVSIQSAPNFLTFEDTPRFITFEVDVCLFCSHA